MKKIQDMIRINKESRTVMTDMEIATIKLLSAIEKTVNGSIVSSEYKVKEVKKLLTDFGL